MDKRVPALAGTKPTIGRVLEELGHNITYAEDYPVEFLGKDVIIEFGNPGYFPRLRKELLRTPREKRPLVAVLYAEPLPAPRASGLPRWSSLNLVEIGKILLRDWRATDIYTNAYNLRKFIGEGSIDMLFVTGREQEEWANEQGYENWMYQYGYHPSHGRLLGLSRNVDVLFLGETRPGRRRTLLDRLRRDGVEVTVRGSWHPSQQALWGEDRVRFLNRTKILIHLQRYPGKTAHKRFVLALANGAMVVSEPAYLPEPLVPGVHYAEAPIEKMPELIRYYLNNEAEREKIALAGHKLITEEDTFERSIRGVVDRIRERLAAQGRPVLQGKNP
ncbi:MAG: glycosyltransferase [Gemmatimonadales bacterium]